MILYFAALPNLPTTSFIEITGPTHLMINISESKCLSLIPTSVSSLIENSLMHLRRIFPKGTRIGSSNFNPLTFWRNGSQVASLNWQVYDRGMQINEAMFVGTSGWVEKPLSMRNASDRKVHSSGSRQKLRVEIVGISSCFCVFLSSSSTDLTSLQCQCLKVTLTSLSQLICTHNYCI